MDIKVFEGIKAKIEALKEKKIKAETNRENIISTWEKEHGVATLEQAQELLEKTNEEIAANDEKKEDLYKELVSLVDWNSI